MQLFLVIFFSVSILFPQDLFFSEYIEGSGANKTIEIYNGTGSDVDLSIYSIKQSHASKNECNERTGFGLNAGNVPAPEYVLNLSGTLQYGDVYIIAHADADAEIIDVVDLTFEYGTGEGQSKIVAHNGDDAMGLFKNNILIDVIGVEMGTCNWSVAGTPNATMNHTLVRKLSVITGNIDWASSAGTSSDNSEWIIYDEDTLDYIGYHGEGNIVITACMDKTAINYNSNATIACDNCCEYPPEVSIYDIQYTLDVGTPVPGEEVCYPSEYGIIFEQQDVRTTGTITAVLNNNLRFYIQDFSSSDDYTGIYVYNDNDGDIESVEGMNPVIGDNITLSAKVWELYEGLTVLRDIRPNSFEVNSTGNTITPKNILTNEITNTCAIAGEKLEGMLVQVNNITIIGIGSDSWYVDDGSGECQISFEIFLQNNESWPEAIYEEEMLSITGVVGYYDGRYSIQPRHSADIDRNFWADAGDDQAVLKGDEVILDGSSSGITDGEIVDYFWEYQSGVPITISDDEAEITSFTAPNVPAEIVIQLTVEDDTGNEVTDQLSIHVVKQEEINNIQYSDENGSGIDDCYPSILENVRIMASGVVTAVNPSTNNFFLQDPNQDEWGGIYIFDNKITPEVGDEFQFGALVTEYHGFTELNYILSPLKLSSDNSINPIDVGIGDLANSCPENSDEGEQYEGMLIKLTDVTIDSVKQYKKSIEWFIIEGGDTVIVSNYYNGKPFYSLEDCDWPAITAGAHFESITGVVSYSWGNYNILPRYGDLVSQSIILGCTDDTACNNNPDANVNDCSCIYSEDNYDCDGNCLVEIDCYGKCGGSAEIVDGECQLDILYSIIPIDYSINNIYPNPFNPKTTISFSISNYEKISIYIYDFNGRLITTLLNENLNPGYYSIIWDAKDSASGIYFAKVVFGSKSISRKLTLLK